MSCLISVYRKPSPRCRSASFHRLSPCCTVMVSPLMGRAGASAGCGWLCCVTWIGAEWAGASKSGSAVAVRGWAVAVPAVTSMSAPPMRTEALRCWKPSPRSRGALMPRSTAPSSMTVLKVKVAQASQPIQVTNPRKSDPSSWVVRAVPIWLRSGSVVGMGLPRNVHSASGIPTTRTSRTIR